jgi:2'-5' RNA ligase
VATLTLVGEADGPDYSGHAMVALYPALAQARQYAMTGGLEPEKMHVTMAYLGLAEDVDKAAVQRALSSLPAREPFAARVSGHARFTGGEEDVLVALVDSPHIEQLRIDLLKALKKEGISISSEHGFTPHMTLAYMDPQALTPLNRLESGNIDFDAVWLKHAKAKKSYPFGDTIPESIRSYARTAYAQGWAASGGPMTPTVMAGCAAAMDLCEANAHDPHILEVAIHLGHLEGVWAKVFQRRFKLMADFTASITELWRQAVKTVDVPGNIDVLRQQLGIREDATDDERRRQARKDAQALALRMLAWLPGTREWQMLRDTMRQLVATGRAEGYADAIDIAAADHDVVGYSFEIAFQHAYDAMANLGDVWAESDSWLQQMLKRSADQFGRVLGELAASDASYQDMVDAAMAVLDMTAEGADAVEFTVDWALSAGFSRGALDLYRSENVEYVTWMTAGDERVCPICEQHGTDSPFLISDFPEMPAHPRCRCVATAEIVLSTDYSGFFS